MKEKVLEYLSNIAYNNGVTVDEKTDLFSTGILDSLGIIMLLTFLQDECAVQFEFDDLNYENYQSLDSIYKWLDSLK